MRVLIAEADIGLSTIWAKYLARAGASVDVANTLEDTSQKLSLNFYDVFILNIALNDKLAWAVSDLATYRNPRIAILCISKDKFFSDGSLFDMVPNARGLVNPAIKPQDLSAMVEHIADHRAAV